MAKFDLAELRSWRKKHGISQEKLATAAGISGMVIYKIESGDTKLRESTITKLLKGIESLEGPQAATPTMPPPAEKPAPVVVAPVAKPEPLPTAKPGTFGPLELSNLDLELIGRILQMEPRKKLQLLNHMMDL